MKKLYWWIRVLLLALCWVPRFNLGDRVWFRGEQWFLIQGVSAPLWDLVRGKKRITVHETEMQKVQSLRNYIGSFRSGYKFYMTNWYRIWVREGIQPWMRGCRIWAK